jgi:nucleoside-diphosphate-sugar epimerase
MDFSRKSVLVLGGSGFIGSRVVAALSASPVYRAVAASRRSAVAVDATDIDSVRALVGDAYYVINCVAGNARAMLRSTQVLCDAARVRPPHRIVHLSSMAVYGGAAGAVQEDHAPVSPVSAYGQAKIACERVVRKYVEDGGDAVILRPTCVFGPGSRQWTTRLVRLLDAGRIGDLGAAGDGRCNLAFIDDVVAAIVEALDTPDISGRTFNISSTCDLTWNEFLLIFGKALGATPVRRIPTRRLKLETKLLAPVRSVASMVWRSPWTEAITPSLASLWQQDIRIDSTAAATDLAMPRTSVEQMIAAVVRTNRLKQEVAFS